MWTPPEVKVKVRAGAPAEPPESLNYLPRPFFLQLLGVFIRFPLSAEHNEVVKRSNLQGAYDLLLNISTQGLPWWRSG